LRQRLKIEEGSILEVREHEEGILFKQAGPLEGREVVGEESYKRMLRKLDSMRKIWR